MKHLKRKRLHNRKIGQKVLLGTTLIVLLWSRIFSSVATIQQVQASFPTENIRGDIQMPLIARGNDTVASHIAIQISVAGDINKRLEESHSLKRKARRIRDFYARWNAPMATHAEYIVQVSEEFGIDWRLIPAISVVESSGGRHCFLSYNAFGWGKHGFSNFEDAIYTVAKGLATGYQTDNPYSIAPKYNPVTPSAWANKVSGLMSQI